MRGIYTERLRAIGAVLPASALAAFFSACTATLAISGQTYTDQSFITGANVVVWLAVLLPVCAMICTVCVRLRRTDCAYWAMLASCVLYFSACAAQREDKYFPLAAAVLIAFTAYYAVSAGNVHMPSLSRRVSGRILVIITAAAGLSLAFFIGLVTVLRYLTHNTPGYDFGLFSQMFESMRTEFLPITTYERGRELSHFAVHISPVYYLILPVYMLFPNPATLQIMQALVVASGIIPLVLLGRKMGRSNAVVAILAVCYALYPAISGGCFYDIHENMFLAPFILWLFYFVESNSRAGMIVFVLLICLVKEDAPVYTAVISLYIIAGRKQIRTGLGLLLLSLIYFISALTLLSFFGEGALTGRYSNYLFGGNDSLFSIVRIVLTDPGYVVSECLDSEKLLYILLMLVPLGFAPVFCKKPAQLILLMPFVLINIMPDYEYMHHLYFQYNFGTGVIMFYLFILNAGGMNRRMRRFICLFAVSASLVTFLSTMSHMTGLLNIYRENLERNRAIFRVLESVPADAEVSSATFFVAPLYRTREIYSVNRDSCTEYIVLDLRYSDDRDLYTYFTKNGYTTVAMEENAAAVLIKNERIEINNE